MKAIKKKIYLYDVLRAIAIVAVLNIHIVGLLASGGSKIRFLAPLSYYSDFGVPLFVLLSAALFYENYKPNQGLSHYYLQKIKKIFLPYLVVSVLYFAIHALKINYDSFYVFMNDLILTAVKGKAAPHLYFVPLIMSLYFVYPYIARLYQKHKMIVTLGSFALSIAFISFFAYVNLPKIEYRWLFMPWLFYVPMGFLLSEHRSLLRRYWLSILIIFSFLISLYFLILNGGMDDFSYLPVILIVMVIFSLSTLVTQVKSSIVKKTVLYLSDHSYQIYLMHYFFIIALKEMMIKGWVHQRLLLVIACYPLLIFGSILIYLPIKYFLEKYLSHSNVGVDSGAIK